MFYQRVLSRRLLVFFVVSLLGWPNIAVGLQFSGSMNFTYGKSDATSFLKNGETSKTSADSFVQAYSLSHSGSFISRRLFPLGITAGYQKYFFNNKVKEGASHSESETIGVYMNSTILPRSPMPIKLEYYRTRDNIGRTSIQNKSRYSNRGTELINLSTLFRGKILPTVNFYGTRSMSITDSIPSDKYGFDFKKGIGIPFVLGNTKYAVNYAGNGRASYTNTKDRGRSGTEGLNNRASITAKTEFSPRSKMTQEASYSRQDSRDQKSQDIFYRSALYLNPTPVTKHTYSYGYTAFGGAKTKSQNHNLRGSVDYNLSSTASLSNQLAFNASDSGTETNQNFNGSTNLSFPLMTLFNNSYSLYYSKSDFSFGSSILGVEGRENYGANTGLSGDKKFSWLNVSGGYDASYSRNVSSESFKFSQGMRAKASSEKWRFVKVSSNYTYTSGITESLGFTDGRGQTQGRGQALIQPRTLSTRIDGAADQEGGLEPVPEQIVIADTSKNRNFSFDIGNTNTKYVRLRTSYRQNTRNAYGRKGESESDVKGMNGSVSLSLIKRASISGAVGKTFSKTFSINEMGERVNATEHDNTTYSASANHSITIFGSSLAYRFTYRKTAANKELKFRDLQEGSSEIRVGDRVGGKSENVTKVIRASYSRNLTRSLSMNLSASRQYSVRSRSDFKSRVTSFSSKFRYRIRVWTMSFGYRYSEQVRGGEKVFSDHNFSFGLGRGFRFGIF